MSATNLGVGNKVDTLNLEIRNFNYYAGTLLAFVLISWLEAWRSEDPWRGICVLSIVVLGIAAIFAMLRRKRKRQLYMLLREIGRQGAERRMSYELSS
jgi:hypothetical protein